ncbi:unnamed protein product [Umbelopsis ramanniana]
MYHFKAGSIAIYGIQCIRATITLLKTFLHGDQSWEVVDLRTAKILISLDTRVAFVRVLEHLCDLDVEKIDQKMVRERLQKEAIGFTEPFDGKDTVWANLCKSQ